jgi:hypothetical protein
MKPIKARELREIGLFCGQKLAASQAVQVRSNAA